MITCFQRDLRKRHRDTPDTHLHTSQEKCPSFISVGKFGLTFLAWNIFRKTFFTYKQYTHRRLIHFSMTLHRTLDDQIGAKPLFQKTQSRIYHIYILVQTLGYMKIRADQAFILVCLFEIWFFVCVRIRFRSKPSLYSNRFKEYLSVLSSSVMQIPN